jgi:flavodoxin
MRKVFKIILAIFTVLIIAFVVFAAIIFLDVAAYTATGSQTLTPSGAAMGTALVAYDPGLSGTAKNVAVEVANDLQSQGYAVTLAGIKSSAAAHTANYSIIVVGGPVYAGAATGSVKDFVDNLNLPSGTRLGVFGCGQGAPEGNDIEQLTDSINPPAGTVVVKIGQPENLIERAQDFVAQLTAPE